MNKFILEMEDQTVSNKDFRKTNFSSDESREKKFSLYIKGVVDGMTRHVLTNAFTTFGTVKHLDVVLSKSCAFVEFETEEAYQQALMQKEIDIPNLGTVTVEERKQKQQRTQNRKSKATYNESPKAPTPITSITSNEKEFFSLYIKGVVAGMNKTVLTSAFTKFGTVKNLDVVLSKSCAFVEFETKKAYQQALMQKEIDIPNLGTVIVEERKPKNNNQNYRNRYRQRK
ncbi:hypothetical protein RclHR1_04220014 [Rhizophagus clarus]|nr:hypothetical protein RclHR1_04220014 [Rhizophagus clarus]